MTELQQTKDKVLELINTNKQTPSAEYYFCWDSTKYGVDNPSGKGVKKVKAGYSPKNLKDLIFLPIL